MTIKKFTDGITTVDAAWLNTVVSRATMEEFLSDAVGGDIAVVDTYDPEWEAAANLQDTAEAFKSVDTDGEYWLVATATGCELRERADISSLVRAFVPSNPVTNVTKAVTNGTHVAIIHDNRIEVFDRDTGTAIWSWDHGAVLTDVTIDNARVYACGATNGVLQNVFGRALADGALEWSLAHDALLNSIATDGVSVVYGGNAAGVSAEFSNGMHVVCVKATNGGFNWEITDETVPGGNRIATDGREVFIASSTVLKRRSMSNGAELGSDAVASIRCVGLDNEFVYAGVSNTVYVARRDSNESAVRMLTLGNIDSICSDHVHVAVASTSRMRTYQRLNNNVRMWRKSKDTDVHLPGARLAIPLS